MLRDVNCLAGYRVHATDGDLGNVVEFFFDDETWTIRYMVVDTGHWLPGRKVLISPVALGQPDWLSKTLPVMLTKEQVRNSPNIDTDKPVSRQHEDDLHTYYSWPVYWGYGLYTGPIYAMGLAAPNDCTCAPRPSGDPHLHSTRRMLGYRIHALDGEIGHVEDCIVDDEKWTLRFLVVDTSNGPPGRKVLISPCWIDRMEWVDSTLYVRHSQESIRNSPAYDPSRPVSADYEGHLYDYYGRVVNAAGGVRRRPAP